MVPLNEATITIISQDRKRLNVLILHILGKLQEIEPNAMIDIHICPKDEGEQT